MDLRLTKSVQVNKCCIIQEKNINEFDIKILNSHKIKRILEFKKHF